MASLAQKLSHSLVNTFFYIWTVIQALLSLRSPDPFPFRETSAVVPCVGEIDLERGSAVRRSRAQGGYPMPAPPLRSSASATSQIIEQATDGDNPWQRRELEYLNPSDLSSPAPSSFPFSEPNPEFTDIDSESASPTALPSSRLHFPNVEGTISVDEANFTETSDMLSDPFLDIKPIAPFPISPSSEKGYQGDDVEPLLFTLPLCTSTPPRKGRKGYKGTLLGAVTNLGVGRIYESSSEPDSLSSPTKTEPVFETPSVQRQRSSSLRQSTLGSPPPAWSTPSRPSMPSITVQTSTPPSSSQEPQFKPVTPLRIVKRNPKDRSSTTSEVSQAVISAVRDAFVESRRENEEEDPKADPRTLLSRASVFTFDAVPLGSSKSDMASIRDDDSLSYQPEEGPATPGTPPPPYALSNPNSLQTLKPVDSVRTFLDMKRFSISTCGSTELQYLATTPGTTPGSSVESRLDDILASFEHLMATMPEFHASVAKTRLANHAMATLEQTDLASAPNRVSGVGPAQWSDILFLDNY